MIKGFTWKKIVKYLPNWLAAREPDSNASDYLGRLGLFLDKFNNDFRRSMSDITVVTAEHREPYLITEIHSDSTPAHVSGTISTGETINITKSKTWPEFVVSPVTRITLSEERVLEDRLIGINFYTEKSGYPDYIEVLTDKMPYEIGCIQKLDDKDRLSKSILDKKKQNQYTADTGDEIVELEFNLIDWFVENNINYKELDYDGDAIYLAHSYKLKHTIVPGTLKVYDAIQDMNGYEILEEGQIVSLGTVTVYNELEPRLNTWWTLENNILTLFNPISSFYVLEYEYYTIQPGPFTRSESYRSVHHSSPRLIIPTYIPPSGASMEQILEDKSIIGDKVEYHPYGSNMLNSAEFPQNSTVLLEIKGTVSIKIDVVFGIGVYNLHNYFNSIMDDPLDIELDLENINYSSKAEVTFNITYDSLLWPVIHARSDATSIIMHIPYTYKKLVKVDSHTEIIDDKFSGIKTYTSQVRIAGQIYDINIDQLLISSSTYKINIKRGDVYTGISLLDVELGALGTGFVISDLLTGTLKIYDHGMNYLGSIPAAGYTVTDYEGSPVFKAKPVKGLLGPNVCVDNYIYYIVWGEDNKQYLWYTDLYNITAMKIHDFTISDKITDITYDGEHFHMSAGNKIYSYKLNHDYYYYNDIDSIITLREEYSGIDVDGTSS